MFLLSSADFFKHFFPKNFRNTIRVSNGLDQDQDRPDLCPNCLQRLSADDKRRQERVRESPCNSKTIKVLNTLNHLLPKRPYHS